MSKRCHNLNTFQEKKEFMLENGVEAAEPPSCPPPHLGMIGHCLTWHHPIIHKAIFQDTEMNLRYHFRQRKYHY